MEAIKEFLFFQVLWLLAAIFYPLNSLWVTLLFLGWFLLYRKFYDQPAILHFIAISFGLGILFESFYLQLGAYQNPNQSLFPQPWLLTLWTCFAYFLYHFFLRVRLKVFLWPFLGAMLAPFSYFATYKLKAIIIPAPYMHSLLIIAGGWAILMPLLATVFKRTLGK